MGTCVEVSKCLMAEPERTFSHQWHHNPSTGYDLGQLRAPPFLITYFRMILLEFRSHFLLIPTRRLPAKCFSYTFLVFPFLITSFPPKFHCPSYTYLISVNLWSFQYRPNSLTYCLFRSYVLVLLRALCFELYVIRVLSASCRLMFNAQTVPGRTVFWTCMLVKLAF